MRFSTLTVAAVLAAACGVSSAGAAVLSADNGGNYSSANPWVSGSDGGTGFNPWAFNNDTSDAVIADASTESAGLNLGPTSFDLTSAVGAATNFYAFRGFSGGPGSSGNSPLGVGQTFTGSVQVNYRTQNPGGLSVEDNTGGALAGVGVSNSDYYFFSNKGNFALDAVPAGDGTEAGGGFGYNPDTIFTLAVTPLADGDLSVLVTRSGGVAATFSTVLAGDGADVEQFSIYSFGAGAGGDPPEQTFFNNFAITAPIATPEPASLGALFVGAAALGVRRRRPA